MEKSEEIPAGRLGTVFETWIAKCLEEQINTGKVDGLIKEAIANKARIPRIVTIEIFENGNVKTLDGRQHEVFPLVLTALKAHVPIALTGPAGSGKTSICINAAEALGIDHYIMPFNPLSSKTDLLGYNDANGNYVASSLYLSFTKGGVFIADEFDAADPGVAVILNSIIANRVATFPNGITIKAHKDFIPICCMNTLGLGATLQYVGRNALDAATLDRFAVIEVRYDEGLEAHFVGLLQDSDDMKLCHGGIPDSTRILKLVRKAREFSSAQKWTNIISPRATILADRLSSAGVGETWIKKMVIYRTLNKEQIKQLDAALAMV